MDLKEIFIKNKCDKATKHRYYELYQQDFDKFKNDKINILEIGTFKGESTNAWLEYFSQAKIYTQIHLKEFKQKTYRVWKTTEYNGHS